MIWNNTNMTSIIVFSETNWEGIGLVSCSYIYRYLLTLMYVTLSKTYKRREIYYQNHSLIKFDFDLKNAWVVIGYEHTGCGAYWSVTNKYMSVSGNEYTGCVASHYLKQLSLIFEVFSRPQFWQSRSKQYNVMLLSHWNQQISSLNV